MSGENKEHASQDYNNNNYDYKTPNERGGKYLFGDYTPFDENENFIHMLKDFVSISSSIIQIHQNAEKLRSVIRNADIFQNEMNTKISEFRESTERTLDSFHMKINEEIINVMFPTSTSTDPFFQIKN